MNISDCFPIWNKLNEVQKDRILKSATERTVKKGTVVHNGSADCIGFLLIKSGLLRAYMLSEDGREITLFRLFEMDMCLFSASCMFQDIQFDINIEAEKETEFWIIPADVYKSIMEESIALSNYTNSILSSHFSDVMWLLEQIMWKSMDKRVAEFLLMEVNLEDNMRLEITHEEIAKHLGTAREVITRMLRYFQSEKAIELSRGVVKIIDKKKLQNFAEKGSANKNVRYG